MYKEITVIFGCFEMAMGLFVFFSILNTHILISFLAGYIFVQGLIKIIK